MFATRQAPLFECVLLLKSPSEWAADHVVPCPAVLAEDAIRSAIRDYKKKRDDLADPKQRGFIDVTQSSITGETHATAHPGAA